MILSPGIGFSVSMISLELPVVVILKSFNKFQKIIHDSKTIYDYLKIFSVDFFSVVVRAKIPSFEKIAYESSIP